MHALARKLNRTPTTADIRAAQSRGERLSLSGIKKHFGSLRAALKAAKLPLTNKQDFTEQQLLDQLRDLSQALGRPLLRRDILRAWKAGTCARPATFKRAFGTVGTAIRKAGAGGFTNPSRPDLVSQYVALSKELGRPATDTDIRRGAREHKCAGIHFFQRIGGGIEKIRLDAGLTTKYSRGVLIAQLKTLAKKLDRTPVAKDIEATSRAGQTAALGTFQAFFGSYRAALDAAGFQPGRAYSRSQLIQSLRELAGKLGHRPTVRDLEKASARGECPTCVPYKRRFGSFVRALEAAGLDGLPGKDKPPPVRKPRPRTDLIEQLRRLADELGRLPTAKDVDEAHARGECASVSLFGAHFGGVTRALQAAGFPALPRLQNRERLIEVLQEMTRELGKLPSSRDIQKAKGKYPAVRTFEKYFGSLPAARKAADLDLILTSLDLPKNV